MSISGGIVSFLRASRRSFVFFLVLVLSIRRLDCSLLYYFTILLY